MIAKASQTPLFYSYWLQAADLSLGPINQIALRWPENDASFLKFHEIIGTHYHPKTILAGASIEEKPIIPEILILLEKGLVQQSTTVYICKGFICGKPITSLDELRKELVNL